MGLGHGTEVLLAVPPGEPVPRPLLVFFHGAGGTAGQSLAAVGDLAGDAGAVVLAPSSAATTWDLVRADWAGTPRSSTRRWPRCRTSRA